MINWTNPLTRSLVLALPLFEKGGGIIHDIANKRVGTLIGGTLPVWVKDVHGTALKFDGSGASTTSCGVDFGNPTLLQIPDFITVAAWVKPTAFGPNSTRIFVREQINNNDPFIDWNLDITSGGLAQFAVSNGSGGSYNNITGAQLVLNQSYFLLGVYDGVNIYIYVNGVLTGSANKTGVLGTTGSNVYLGCDAQNPSASEGFIGNMWNALLWKRALSPFEIQQLYANPWQIYTKPGMLQPLNSVASAVRNNTFKTLTGSGNI